MNGLSTGLSGKFHCIYTYGMFGLKIASNIIDVCYLCHCLEFVPGIGKQNHSRYLCYTVTITDRSYKITVFVGFLYSQREL